MGRSRPDPVALIIMALTICYLTGYLYLVTWSDDDDDVDERSLLLLLLKWRLTIGSRVRDR